MALPAFLASEIEVYSARTEVGLAEDTLHGGPLKTATGETMKRGLQDLAAAAGAAGSVYLWRKTNIRSF